MYDYSYNQNTLAVVMQKGDFKNISSALRDEFRKQSACKATESAITLFGSANPIIKFHLKKKSAYRINKLEDELVVRKLSRNIKRVTKISPKGRSYLITNLIHFLEEGVPYRVYRLDVKSFYESFKLEDVVKKTSSLQKLGAKNRKILEALLKHYLDIGGQGLPRGMALSAVLSDLMMSKFDSEIFSCPSVYFYGRYVDDIIIVTNLTEDKTLFINNIKEILPDGLVLNEKKLSMQELPDRISDKKIHGDPRFRCDFSYLGYQFSIFDPTEEFPAQNPGYRIVKTEIAVNKIKKIKLRIVRSFIDFQKTKDSALLLERLKYLSSNFSVTDKNTGKKKLAGIFHSYPHLSVSSTSLAELNRFLRNAVLSRKGKLFAKTFPLLDAKFKRQLLAQDFIEGHSTQRFIHFSPLRIQKIQECWQYE